MMPLYYDSLNDWPCPNEEEGKIYFIFKSWKKFTWKSSRIDDVDAVGGHQTPLGLWDVSTDGSTLGKDGVVVTERLTAPTCFMLTQRYKNKNLNKRST